MNRNDLFKSFNEIDDDILKRSESAVSNKKYPAPLRWGTIAAGILIMIVTIAPFFSTNNAPSTSTGTFTPQISTSDTYSNLPELLEYVSKNEEHESKYDSDVRNNPSSTLSKIKDNTQNELIKGAYAVVNSTETYSYHIVDKTEIHISQFYDKSTKNVGSIKTDTALWTLWIGDLFIYNNSLITVSSGYLNTEETEELVELEKYTKISIYDITDPGEPILEDEFIQTGVYVDCWMVGSNLYLATDDGECACGYSKSKDMSDYYPALYHNEKPIEWGDDSIFILGEPTRIAYTAISVVNTDSRKIESKTALYGDITDMYYGADWIAVMGGNSSSLPTLYGFDKNLICTGKINISEIVNIDNCTGSIDSVAKVGNTYRMIGTYRTTSLLNQKGYYLAISADIQTGKYGVATLPITNNRGVPYTEIVWEQNRTILCAVKEKDYQTDRYSIAYETKFIFAEFDAFNITFYENQLIAEYIDKGIVYTAGNPFGEFETLISMGNGIYVRYLNGNKGPGGFEVYDFSSSAAPKRIWKSETSLSGTDAFDFYWKVYDENTFGTLKAELNPGDTDYYRNIKLSWCIYSVNPDDQNAVTLKKEYPLNIKAESFTSAQSMKFEIFTVGNNLYYTSEYNDTVQKLELPPVA